MTLDPSVIAAIQGATRGAVYGAATLVAGAAAFDTLVLRRAAGLTPAERNRLHSHARRIGFVAACVLVAAYAARFYVQVIDSFLVAWPTMEMVRQLIFSTRAWGLGMLAQLIVSLSVVVLLFYAQRAQIGGGVAVAASALLAPASVPLTGHAVAHAGAIAVTVQATHVLAVGGWLGTLAVLWTVCRRLESTEQLSSIVRAFSPVALSSAALLGIAGAGTYFLHVGTLDQVLSSRYGVVLLMKVAVFLSAAAVGYVNWRHLTPRLGEPGQRRRFTHAAALEIGLAIVALVLTTVLTNLSIPNP